MHRVPSRCKAKMPELSREFITKEICQKVKGDFPPNGLKVGLYDPNTKQIQTQTQKNFPLNGLKVPLYLTGKADCAGDGDTNKWMDPVKIPDDVIIIIISSYHHHHHQGCINRSILPSGMGAR